MRAAPHADVRAAPHADVRAAPPADARAAPPADVRAAPPADVRADRHEDRPANRPVLDNWIQVVKKPKREVKGRGEAHSDNKRGERGNRASYASTVIGKATGLHIRASKREANIFVSRLDPSVTCDELADHLQCAATSAKCGASEGDTDICQLPLDV